MDLVTIYKAFRKQAAGVMPENPTGGVFKPKPLPSPISAPGTQPIGQPGDPAAVPADPSMTPDKSMQMLEKGWEKTMDTMKQMTAMNNGVPVEESGAPAPVPPAPPAGQPPMPGDGIAPQPLPKMASADYGKIYQSMKKRAILDGEDWQTWMIRKDALNPGAYQHLRAQDNGAVTSFLTSLLLGGGLGYGLDKAFNNGDRSTASTIGGAAIGGGLAMLANLIGKGAGYVMPTRSKAKHDKYQNSGTAAEWLIPGVANYNKVKTYGYALHGEEKQREEEEKKRKQQEALPKAASWLGRQVNNVFGADTWVGRTFGESPETAAENFYNQQIGSEAVANRKQLAAQYDAEQAKERSRVNAGVDQAVAAEQKRTQDAEAQRLAKQKAADKYIQQLAAQQGVQLSDAQRSKIQQNAGVGTQKSNTALVAASKPASTKV